MIDTTEKTVGEIVTEDYRTAPVFQSFGIDFCCRGNITVSEACSKKNVNEKELMAELGSVRDIETDPGIDFKSWSPDLLADYIEKKHHRYVEETIPVLKQYLFKLRKVHGDRHPELHDVASLFSDGADALTTHMKKEELVLFPFIRKMIKVQREGGTLRLPHFGTIENPVGMMKQEHETEGERFRQINALTNGYMPPPDACNTYRVAYEMLRDFERDLHHHIHLENNILFPAAVNIYHKLN